MQLIALESCWLKAEGLGTGWSFVPIKIILLGSGELHRTCHMWGHSHAVIRVYELIYGSSFGDLSIRLPFVSFGKIRPDVYKLCMIKCHLLE